MASYSVVQSDGGGGGGSVNQDFRSNAINWVTIHKAYSESSIKEAHTRLENFRLRTIDINEAIANAGVEGVGPITVGPNYAGILKMEDRRERLDTFSGDVHGDILDLVDEPFEGRIKDLKVSVTNNGDIKISGENGIGSLGVYECDQEKIRQWLAEMMSNGNLDDEYDVEDKDVEAAIKEYETYDSETGKYGYEEALEDWDNLDDAHKEAIRHLYEYYFRVYEYSFDDNDPKALEAKAILERMNNKLYVYSDEFGLCLNSSCRELGAMMVDASGHSASIISQLCASGGHQLMCTGDDPSVMIPPDPNTLNLTLMQDKAGIRLVMEFGIQNDSSWASSEDLGYYTSKSRSLKYIRTEEANGVSYDHLRSLGFDSEALADMLTSAQNSNDMTFLDNLTKNKGDYDTVFIVTPNTLSASCAETFALYLETLKAQYYYNGSEACRQEAVKINTYMMVDNKQNSAGYFDLYNYGLYSLSNKDLEKKTILEEAKEVVGAFGRGVENELLMLPMALTDLLVALGETNVKMLPEEDLQNINLDRYWKIANEEYQKYLYLRESNGEKHDPFLEGEDLQYIKDLYYSYLAYYKKNYVNLTLTQEMVNQLEEIKALLALVDDNYASKFHFDYERERIAIAEKDHPWAFGLGRIAGDAAIYMMLSPLGGTESVLAQESLGAAAKVFGKNVLIGTAKDLVVKDIPAAVAELAQGKDVIVVMQDTGKAIVYDLAGNVLGELTSVAVDALRANKAIDVVDDVSDDVKVKDPNKQVIKSTPELENHLKYKDPNVPRKRGIGGAHNRDEFMKNDIMVVSETASDIDGVTVIEYRMPKLDAQGNPTGDYGSKVFEKTVYDASVISDEEYIARGMEAANYALEHSDDGVMPREWVGIDSQGHTWRGYYEDGKVTSLFPE